MVDIALPPDDASELARRLGQRGGRQTKRRGSAYYARIGRLGAYKRWHGSDPDATSGDHQEQPPASDDKP